MPTNPFTIDPRNYKYGARGDHIKSLQEALIFAGYEVSVDGIFGNETKSAIERFEIDHSYNDTLSFATDQRTLTMLFNQVCVDVGPTPPPTEPPTEPEPEPPKQNDWPAGKGMFVRSLTGTGTVENMKQYITERGIQWVCVQRLWQYDDPNDDVYYNGSSWVEYSRAWEETDCELWIWGWPVPNRESEFVEVMANTQRDWKARGIIMDCEVPWYGEGDRASILSDMMLEIGCPIGLTSYGAPWYHTNFPLESFSNVDFGIPQIYDSQNSMPENYPTQSVEEWRRAGYERVIPASSAYKTPAEMEDLLSRTPTPETAIIWWDWYNANLAAGRWDVIGQYQFDVSLAKILARGNT